MTGDRILYGYWRSSAAYRVRIALNLKGLAYLDHPVHLLRDGGQQHGIAYRAINPQALVPTLCDGELQLTQSLAIIEYLDETYLEAPLLPPDAAGRARVRALAQIIASDTHPLANLRVLQHLERTYAADQAQRLEWTRHWINVGLTSLEAMLARSRATGRYCHGDTPGMADLCLVPQVYNVLRWGMPLDVYPTVARIHAACVDLAAFQRAHPEAQPDAHA